MPPAPEHHLLGEMEMLAERLRELREARGLTQTRLAEMLAVSPRVYNRWEMGAATPRFDTVVQLADLLGVTLDELAGRKAVASRPKIQNPKLRDLYEHVDQLADEDQQALMILLDSLIKRAQVEHVVGR